MTTSSEVVQPPSSKVFVNLIGGFGLLVIASVLLTRIGILPSGTMSVEQLSRILQSTIAKNIRETIPLPGVPKPPPPKNDKDGRFTGSRPSALALRTIPPGYLHLCRKWGAHYKTDWRLGCSVLRSETNFGQDSQLPGVISGVNAHGCCRGPGQFNTENGEGRRIYVRLSRGHSYSYRTDSTWASKKVDGNRDGTFDIFDPEDAVPSTFRYLSDSGGTTRSGWKRALWAYNQSTSYGNKIMNRAGTYGAPTS